MITPYLQLGVPTHASDADIRQRYLELVKQHPPSVPGSRFAEIQRAYERIKDARSRVHESIFGALDEADAQAGLEALCQALHRGRRITLPALVEAMEASDG
jgi:curved DNA-binding protein CbpA